jgi:hypothetical protein
VLTERKELRSVGPRLTIWHRFQEPGIIGCSPGEEIFLISLPSPRGHVPIKLSLSLKILIDYLARHRHVPQSASQIEAGIRADVFSIRHGCNAMPNGGRTRRICRSAVRVYVERFRGALSAASGEIGQMLDPKSVLLSEATDGNEVLYRLKASVQWCHLPLQDSTDDWSGHPWVRVGSLIGNQSV